MTRIRLVRFAVSSAVASVLSTAATATDLIDADFEDTDYALGTLTGQNGWVAYRDANPGSIQVTVPGAFSGDQGVTIDGATMQLYPTGLYRGYYYPPVNYTLTGTGNTYIEFSCDVAVFFSGPDATLDVAWQTQFYSTTGVGLGGIGIESYGDGTIEAYVFSFLGDAFAIPHTPGTWVHFVARLDYTTGLISASVDGTPIGDALFDDSEEAFGDADLVMICDQPFTSHSYIDNYRIVAGPVNPNPCPGDLDGNNQVNLSDLTVLLANFGSVGPDLPGDLDDNGQVNLSDLTVLLANFGTVCP